MRTDLRRRPRDVTIQRAVELMAPLAHALMRRREQEDDLTPFPVRDVDVRALSFLATVDTMPMRDLAALLQVTPGRVTQIIARLEATGHVFRQRDADDRRIWQVGLTGPARRAVDSHYARRSQAVEATMEGLSMAGRAAVVHFLEELVARLSRIEREEASERARVRPQAGPESHV